MGHIKNELSNDDPSPTVNNEVPDDCQFFKPLMPTTSFHTPSTAAESKDDANHTPTFHFTRECFYHQAEFGVVGVEQGDETHYDRRSSFGSTSTGDNNLEFTEESEEFSEQTEKGRIQFSSKKLYGRDEEVEILLQHLDSSLLQKPQQQDDSSVKLSSRCAVLAGLSGTGKTRLVQESVHKWIEKTGIVPIFIKGKYEEFNKSPDPYHGISHAFSKWCNTLSYENKQVLRDYLVELTDKVGNDAAVLLDLIPALSTLIKVDDRNPTNPTSNISNMSNISNIPRSRGLNRDTSRNVSAFGSFGKAINKDCLRHAFHEFMKCLCDRIETPLIFFLDDLQWADADSLELLVSLLQDPQIPYLFFIGAYRSNELDTSQDSDQPLAIFLHKLNQAQALSNRNKQDMIVELSDVSKETVNEFIADTLDLSMNKSKALSEAIFCRTFGNMFFTMQALEQLVRENALYYDMISFQWSWVLPQEQLEALLSSEVIDMVKSKIEYSIPHQVRRLLIVASYSKSSFEASLLRELMNREENHSTSWTLRGIRRKLDRAVREGILVRNRKQKDIYTFAHDRIREAAMAFVSGYERDQIINHVGMVLAEWWESSSTHKEDWMVFTALNHLTSVPKHYHDSMGKIQIAKLCLDAGELSRLKASFEKAAEYARQGIECWLPEDKWTSQTQLCRDLYILAAESHRQIGDVGIVESYCSEFFDAQGEGGLDSTFLMYEILSKAIYYGSKDRHEEAKDIVLRLLRHNGCAFPASKLAATSKILFKLVRLACTKKRRSKKELQRLKPMTDPRRIETMRLLSLLLEIAFLSNHEDLAGLVAFRGMDYTLRYGTSMHCPRFFATASIFFTAGLNDLEGGEIYARYSLDLAKLYGGDKEVEAMTASTAYAFGLHHVCHVKECIPAVQKSFEVGVRSGLYASLFDISTVVNFSILVGRPLSLVELEIERGLPMIDKKLCRQASLGLKGTWNIVRTLLGKELVGIDVSPEEDQIPIIGESLRFDQRVSYTYMGEYEKCAESAVLHGAKCLKAAPGSCVPNMDSCMSALSCLVMLQKDSNPQYKKVVSRSRKLVSSWVNQGNPNLLHWDALLDAETAVLKKKPKIALEKFSEAVDLANKGGYTNDAGLANERWGVFALEVLGDQALAANRLTESIELNKRWGAVAKVKKLQEDHKSLLEQAM